MPKFSTCFFPIKDTYTRIFSSQTHNGYFGGYQTKNQITYLTLFKITGQGFKKLVSLKLNSVGMKLSTNALHFLKNPYECLFIPGDGSLKYLDFKKKAVISETASNNYEGFKYHSRYKILAVKRKEELQLMKLIPQKEIVSMNKTITGHEIFQDGLSRPTVAFFLTQYSDLKDYIFDEENNLLYTVFAWVSWTRKSASLSLPPSITHLRFQKWNVNEGNVELVDQRDIEWNHSRNQIFNLHVKGKQCLVSEPNGIYIISLEDYRLKEKILGKRYLGISKDNNVILQETNRNFFGVDFF